MGIGRLVVKNIKNNDGTYSYRVRLRFGKHIRVPGTVSDRLEDIGCWIIQTAGHIHEGSIKQRVRRD